MGPEFAAHHSDYSSKLFTWVSRAQGGPELREIRVSLFIGRHRRFWLHQTFENQQPLGRGCRYTGMDLAGRFAVDKDRLFRQRRHCLVLSFRWLWESTYDRVAEGSPRFQSRVQNHLSRLVRLYSAARSQRILCSHRLTLPRRLARDCLQILRPASVRRIRRPGCHLRHCFRVCFFDLAGRSVIKLRRESKETRLRRGTVVFCSSSPTAFMGTSSVKLASALERARGAFMVLGPGSSPLFRNDEHTRYGLPKYISLAFRSFATNLPYATSWHPLVRSPLGACSFRGRLVPPTSDAFLSSTSKSSWTRASIPPTRDSSMICSQGNMRRPPPCWKLYRS